jgi:hypothetical protein
MFTEKGQELLRLLQNAHRFDYLYRNPDCNENDIERDFLFLLFKEIPLKLSSFEELKKLLDEIR